MKLDAMSFFQVASQRMTWLGARQQVVSENIANADTPGFKAREVSSFAEMVRESGGRPGGVSTTDTRHIEGNGDRAGIRTVRDDSAWEQSIDGNTVTLEEQTIKANEISENYRLAAELYRKGHSLLTLAASGK